jgi:hypothetical protein
LDSPVFKNLKYSVGTKKRFQIPNSTKVLAEQVPVQYQAQTPENRYRINKVAIGYGERSDFTGLEKKRVAFSPGPIYNHHLRNSISYKSEHLKKS